MAATASLEHKDRSKQRQQIPAPRQGLLHQLMEDWMINLNKSGPEWTLWTVWGKEKTGLFGFDSNLVWRRHLLWKYLNETMTWATGEEIAGNMYKFYVVTLKRRTQTEPCIRFEIHLTDFTCTAFGSPEESWYLELPPDLGEFLDPVLVLNERFLVIGGCLDVASKTLRLRVFMNKTYEHVTIFHFVVNSTGRPKSYKKPYGLKIDKTVYEAAYHKANTTALKVVPQSLLYENDDDGPIVIYTVDSTGNEPIPNTPLYTASEVRKNPRPACRRRHSAMTSEWSLSSDEERSRISQNSRSNVDIPNPRPCTSKSIFTTTVQTPSRQSTSTAVNGIMLNGRSMTSSTSSYGTAECNQTWLDDADGDEFLGRINSQHAVNGGSTTSNVTSVPTTHGTCAPATTTTTKSYTATGRVCELIVISDSSSDSD